MANRVIDVFGDPVEVLVSSAATGNAFSAMVQTCQPGGGPPPHSHDREDEFFYPLEGEFEMFDGAAWHPVATGAAGFGMRGGVHTFRNRGSTPGRMMVVVTPGGLDEYFAAIEGLKMPDDSERVMEISASFGITFAPPGE